MGVELIGDLLIQVRAELLGNPDSWLANEIYSWYDFLYRKSSEIDAYQGTSTPPQGFEQYDYSSLQNFLISVAIEQGEKQFKNLVKEAEKSI